MTALSCAWMMRVLGVVSSNTAESFYACQPSGRAQTSFAAINRQAKKITNQIGLLFNLVMSHYPFSPTMSITHNILKCKFWTAVFYVTYCVTTCYLPKLHLKSLSLPENRNRHLFFQPLCNLGGLAHFIYLLIGRYRLLISLFLGKRLRFIA